MAKQELRSLHHCVYSLQYHLVLTTKFCRPVITDHMKQKLEEIFRQTLQKWDCSLIEFNGEADHVHLLFEANPTIALTKLVNNLKTVSSRLIRRDFPVEIRKVYRKPVFWHRSYCLLSYGGEPISIIRRYVENQDRDK